MSRFYGKMWGSAENCVTRTGGAESGVSAHVRGWGIGGRVEVFDQDGKDVVILQVTGGSNNSMVRETPWIEVALDRETGELLIKCRPGKEGKVIRW